MESRMELVVEKLIYPGKSLARREGKIVLTDEGLAGETVEVIPGLEKKDYLEARTVRIIRPSPHRVEPRCPHYRVCSPYQYVDYSHQLKVKEEQLREIFSRQLKLDLPDLTVRPAPRIWEYRNRVHLHLRWKDGLPALAYHAPGSATEFVDVDRCFLVPAASNGLLSSLLKAVTAERIDFIDEVTVRESSSRGQLLLVLYARPGENAVARIGKLAGLQKEISLAGAILADKTSGKNRLLFGRDFLEEEIDGITFRVGAESFFQVNVGMLKVLLRDLRESVPADGKKLFADLYCGVGTFGLLLAPQAAGIIAVESEEANLSCLKKNVAAGTAGNVTVWAGDCGRNLSRVLGRDPDAIIVDPPRRGLGGVFCRRLREDPPPVLAYVSCNPSTLARDLQILFPAYELRKMYLYDFFPHTAHIETLSLLEAA